MGKMTCSAKIQEMVKEARETADDGRKQDPMAWEEDPQAFSERLASAIP